jgi:hypothetical protein
MCCWASASAAFVEPLVQMVIDGSPMGIVGAARPFQVSHDSVVDLKLHRLDLPLYVSYAPMKLPVKIPQGMLSTDLYLHFVQAQSQPLILTREGRPAIRTS